jgi:hypothetical protein
MTADDVYTIRPPTSTHQRLLLIHWLVSLPLKLGDEAGPILRLLAGCDSPAVAALHALSPLERAIVDAIEDAGEPLQGKQIASAIGHAYDATLKTILRCLRDRFVLGHQAREGYFVAATVPAGPLRPAEVEGPADQR